MLERISVAEKPTGFEPDKCFIGGRWVEPRSGRTLPLEDPSRGVEIGAIARGEAADIDAAVEAAERALAGGWGKLTATERGAAHEARRPHRRADRRARAHRGARRRGRQMRLAKALRSGQVFVNNYGAGGGVELPFGGVGKSGHGREKGFEALYGFSALKTVAAWHG